jgi:hypothetical protein
MNPNPRLAWVTVGLAAVLLVPLGGVTGVAAQPGRAGARAGQRLTVGLSRSWRHRG